jgi:hypothetical protein
MLPLDFDCSSLVGRGKREGGREGKAKTCGFGPHPPSLPPSYPRS